MTEAAMTAPKMTDPKMTDPKTTDPKTTEIDAAARTELEAAVYRRLVAHLQGRADVQNIDLMNMAGFCRNCLSNWMKDAADAAGLAMSKGESRERVYGMPYEEWKRLNQPEATPDQQAAFAKAQGESH